MTCALYEEQQTTKTFSIEGVTDENYYTALLGYPPTIIASDQVVKTFANHPITTKDQHKISTRNMIEIQSKNSVVIRRK